MTNKLYVANLPADTTEEALRRHFAACGGVCDVEIMPDRRAGKPRGLASVTMTSPAYALAGAKLDGVDFGGKQLRVSNAPLPVRDAQAAKVKILLQFREHGHMTYDLDCEGLPLTVRVFPTDDGGWRIEARSTEAADAVVIHGAGESRGDALTAVLLAWNAAAITSGVGRVDGDGLATAMRAVRAV